jgi:hypothetical protein
MLLVISPGAAKKITVPTPPIIRTGIALITRPVQSMALGVVPLPA